MPRTKASARKSIREETSSHEGQRAKKWDKSDAIHYNRMKNVAIPATQLACPHTLMKLGIKADIEGLFMNMGLGRLCGLHEPTYPELVRQFLASAYVTYPADSDHDGFLAFVVEKKYFEVSFKDICELFGLSAGERTSGLYWTNELLEFWRLIGSGVYGSPQSKEALIRSPVLRYATRLIGSLLYGTTTSASVTQWELCLLYQGVRHLLPAFGSSSQLPISAFNLGAVLATNLAGYKGKVSKSKNRVCGFGAVITTILRYVDIDLDSHQPVADRAGDIVWNYLDMQTLVSKEFIAGPYSKIGISGPYIYVFQDRTKRTLYCTLPQPGITALASQEAVEFLPPATALTEKPAFFTPKYQGKGKAIDAEREDEAAQDTPDDDDSQPHQLLPSDSSQYRLEELPANPTTRQQQQWSAQSIKKNNDMLHKIWEAISKIRPCRCNKDDVAQPHNATSSSSSGSSGMRRPGKKSKRTEETEGTSRAADAE